MMPAVMIEGPFRRPRSPAVRVLRAVGWVVVLAAETAAIAVILAVIISALSNLPEEDNNACSPGSNETPIGSDLTRR